MAVLSAVRAALLVAFAGVAFQGCSNKTNTEKAVDDLHNQFTESKYKFQNNVEAVKGRRLQTNVEEAKGRRLQSDSIKNELEEFIGTIKKSVKKVSQAISRDLEDADIHIKFGALFSGVIEFTLRIVKELVKLAARLIESVAGTIVEFLDAPNDDKVDVLRKFVLSVIEHIEKFIKNVSKEALKLSGEIQDAIEDN
eukprot:GEMP01068669.1.p1 GENE.GEMP01068669.1~~GEMP01068669.1.p1  ORF type:complete len:229 (+),score=18.37 GEMP01068669.1:101-688(+)